MPPRKSSEIRRGNLKFCAGPCERWLDEQSGYPSKAAGKRHGKCRDCFHGRPAGTHVAAPVPTTIAATTNPLLPRLRWPSVAEFDAAVTSTDDQLLDPREAARREREIARQERELEKIEAAERAAEMRINSDFDALKATDFYSDYAVGVGNQAESPQDKIARSKASQEKRQEFNRQMGEFAQDLRDAAEQAHEHDGEIGPNIPAHHATYIASLAEQERRFGNRKWARSVSIMQAHEQLAREGMIHVAETYFKDKITPTGYAALPRSSKPIKRTACLLLSDIHLGSELDSLDEPAPYRAVEEARRLEYIMRQFVEFKPQYRDTSSALVIINGDIIEGMLLHDLRSGSPLTEQQAIFWHYFTVLIAYIAAAYREVHVECQPGNHGRNKLRHPGRATSSKWDGIEGSIYLALQMMCSGLKNVTWSIPHQAVSIVDLFGSKLGITHGDTEIKLGDPDTKSKDNAAALDKVNSTRIYGCEFDAWAMGHFHKPRYRPGNPKVIWNGALVPPNGHARASGYIGESQGQWIWESVEGFVIGDLRFIEVGPTQDHDERLGTLIKPFRFSMAA